MYRYYKYVHKVLAFSYGNTYCTNANTHFNKGIFLDGQSTTPVDPRVLHKMMTALTGTYGNAHSRTHNYGWEAEELVEQSRAEIAKLIRCEPKEIVFTSGATESNNIAIKGISQYYYQSLKNNASGDTKPHIITLLTEHKCVLDSCRSVELEGIAEVTYLPVKSDGLVNLTVLENAIKPNTKLISVMSVHNEIGVIQPIREIGAICRKHRVLLHTDAAQAVGKVDIDVNRDGIDLLSLSGHKMYAPKGIGCLFTRRRRPRVRLASPVSGGGQERGLRSGTLPVPLVAAVGEAAAIYNRNTAQQAIAAMLPDGANANNALVTPLSQMEKDYQHCKKLSDLFLSIIRSKLTHVTLNGSETRRWPGNLNLSFAAVEGESLLMGMKEIAVSSGSACTSASLESSYVLRALGVDAETAHTSIRFGITRFTTREEIEYTANKCIEVVTRLRNMSPLWDLLLEGKTLAESIKNN